MAGTLKVGTITTPSGSGSITIPSGVALSGHNYPAFEARLSADQIGGSDNTDTKIQIDNEIFDTDNCYDNSTNYRFTPTVAGKYYVYGSVGGQPNPNANTQLVNVEAKIFKNGSLNTIQTINTANSFGRFYVIPVYAVIELNGSTDYVELYGNVDYASATSVEFSQLYTIFGAYRIGA